MRLLFNHFEQIDEEILEVLECDFLSLADNFILEDVEPILSLQRHVEVLAHFEEVALCDLLGGGAHFFERLRNSFLSGHVPTSVEVENLLESPLLLLAESPVLVCTRLLAKYILIWLIILNH